MAEDKALRIIKIKEGLYLSHQRNAAYLSHYNPLDKVALKNEARNYHNVGYVSHRNRLELLARVVTEVIAPEIESGIIRTANFSTAYYSENGPYRDLLPQIRVFIRDLDSLHYTQKLFEDHKLPHTWVSTDNDFDSGHRQTEEECAYLNYYMFLSATLKHKGKKLVDGKREIIIDDALIQNFLNKPSKFKKKF